MQFLIAAVCFCFEHVAYCGEDMDDFSFQYGTCHMCGGYYGPSFSEPVCATCHSFLFPEDINLPEDVLLVSEKTDDGDSGNDEPNEPYFGPETHRDSPQRPLPPVQRVDRLAERLIMLSVPRPVDNMPADLVEMLPAEVLMAVFSYLDDISLWSIAQVCKRWRQLLQSFVTQEDWSMYTKRRWPLFKPFYQNVDWFHIYTRLIESAPCKQCLSQMAVHMKPHFDENSWRRNRLRNEIRGLNSDPPEGIAAQALDRTSCHWFASITGPVGSPYEGGVFYLYLQIPYSYPMRPPMARFLTRIFHPNVSRHGDIGIDSIQHNWSLALTISKVLISIQSLFTDPYCKVCMEPEVGEIFLNDRKRFNKIAQKWTWKYAMHDFLLPNINQSST